MPEQIEKMFPELWVDEDEDEGKNLNEEPLIRTQIERYRRHDSFSYHKINDSTGADKLLARLNELTKNDLNVIVVNFIDMLSHARTESKMVRELANNESAYRSITLSWFRHSVMADLLNALSQIDCKIIITTDHGSIRASKPVKIVGDRNTNTNLRYKLGKNLSCQSKEVFVIRTRTRRSCQRRTSVRRTCSPPAARSSPTPTTTTTTCRTTKTRSSTAAFRSKRCSYR